MDLLAAGLYLDFRGSRGFLHDEGGIATLAILVAETVIIEAVLYTEFPKWIQEHIFKIQASATLVAIDRAEGSYKSEFNLAFPMIAMVCALGKLVLDGMVHGGVLPPIENFLKAFPFVCIVTYLMEGMTEFCKMMFDRKFPEDPLFPRRFAFRKSMAKGNFKIMLSMTACVQMCAFFCRVL